jgi:hypothetical protein
MTRSGQSPVTTAIAAALFMVAACSPTAPAGPSSKGISGSPTSSSAEPATASPSRDTRPSLPSAQSIGEAPEGCPGPEPEPQAVADFIGPVTFGPPLWAGIYGGYEPTTNTYSTPDAPLTEHGWRVKILFLLEPAHDSAVELVGRGVDGTDGAVLFAIEGTDPSALATFDPQDPAIPVQHEGWREYPTYAYFPSPGCFRLTATWPGGTSELGFGLGG